MTKKTKCPQCPRCGGRNVEFEDIERKSPLFDGIIYFDFIGFILRFVLAEFVLIYYDIWAYLIKKILKKGYIWKSKRIMSSKIKYYYCPDCHKEFKE